MNLINTRIGITAVATFSAIIFIILSYLFPEHSTFILTIEVILLPAIYIIGNYYAENVIEEQYEQIIDFISDKVELLEEKYNKERLLNIRLRGELDFLKKNGKKKK